VSILEKLFKIQQAAKSTKSQYNSFGGYSYRSAESIIEDIKPILKKENALIILSDLMKEVGGRVYVCATAKFVDLETGEETYTTAFAREAETKKGMDEAQITGAASSYARKYALSGLLLLDDNKDADTEEYQSKANPDLPPPPSKSKTKAKAQETEAPKVIKSYVCNDCKMTIEEHQGVEPKRIAEATKKKYGVMLCVECANKRKQADLPFEM